MLINLHLKGAMDIDDWSSNCSCSKLRYIPFQAILGIFLVAHAVRY